MIKRNTFEMHSDSRLPLLMTKRSCDTFHVYLLKKPAIL